MIPVIDNILSFVISYLMASASSFLCHRAFTFKKKDKVIRRSFKYIVVLFIGILISTTFGLIAEKTSQNLFLNFLKVETLIKATAIFITALTQLLLNKYWTFRRYD